MRENHQITAFQKPLYLHDTLSKRYSEDPEAERRDLQDIRRKYGIKR
jgi:hypothetical protein